MAGVLILCSQSSALTDFEARIVPHRGALVREVQEALEDGWSARWLNEWDVELTHEAHGVRCLWLTEEGGPWLEAQPWTD